MAGLRTFLEQFGHRESRLDIIYPTWGEDPTPVLRFVRSYLASEGGTDPAAMEKRVAAKRRAAEERVRAGISKGLPGRVFWKPVFAWAADYNAALGGQRDTMHFHVTASFPTLRGLLRESGRRLAAAGRLQRTDDVFFLELDEILLHPAEPSIDLGSVASGRRRAWEHERSGPWPVAIKAGDEVYADEPAEARELAAHRHLAGIPGSPGRAQGVVRIVRGPEDFDRVRQGDVLVAPITNPVWTPLFAVVSAVVTDVGGVLSHGAIVAREYGIPAVVGARNATGRLREGQRVMVDGSRGVVTLIEDE
jgi:pyruvate,water dikinase